MVPRPPLVLVHGMWGQFALWGETASLLEDLGWPILPYELPEHGGRRRSDAVLARLGLEDYLDDLVAFLGSAPSSPILVGHSMGGLLVLLAAQRLSARGRSVRGIVLIAPAGIRGSFLASRSNLLLFLRPLLSQWRGPRVHRPTRRAAAFALFSRVPPDRRAGLFSLMGPESIRPLLQTAFWPFDPSRITRLVAGAIVCPSFLYLGGRDRVIPRYSVGPLRRILPHIEITIEPEAGHLVFHESVRQAFFSWLASRLNQILSDREAKLA